MTQQAISLEVLALLACPVCRGTLSAVETQIVCASCHCLFPIEDGIPVLLADRAFSTKNAGGYRDK